MKRGMRGKLAAGSGMVPKTKHVADVADRGAHVNPEPVGVARVEIELSVVESQNRRGQREQDEDAVPREQRRGQDLDCARDSGARLRRRG